MSDASEPAPSARETAGGPEPEPIRFFGTTWLDHSGKYGLRRAAVALGSISAAFGGCLLLRFAYEGLEIAQVGAFVDILVVAVFAICSALAFRRTWDAYSRRPDPRTQASLRSATAIGFIGALLAYFLRSLTEAPGEQLRRAEYEAARKQYERRTSRRAGNPANRGKKKRA
ncbi:EamA/RhaT family transporter [Streptomyces cavernicola]|uniref:EamA/RhaT family transporter n=1 Tax=Streptomyces cavernicola TaxID=3043613 RepID=A0ABT6SFA4_9ACTN|nr:EamA/RhaT family transporter [Streptomyces sp. B-S-A6]MDI3406840.1 EamA/RhaT family transporter [Streptomyces sp. B-S-A6]